MSEPLVVCLTETCLSPLPITNVTISDKASSMEFIAAAFHKWAIKDEDGEALNYPVLDVQHMTHQEDETGVNYTYIFRNYEGGVEKDSTRHITAKASCKLFNVIEGEWGNQTSGKLI